MDDLFHFTADIDETWRSAWKMNNHLAKAGCLIIIVYGGSGQIKEPHVITKLRYIVETPVEKDFEFPNMQKFGKPLFVVLRNRQKLLHRKQCVVLDRYRIDVPISGPVLVRNYWSTMGTFTWRSIGRGI